MGPVEALMLLGSLLPLALLIGAVVVLLGVPAPDVAARSVAVRAGRAGPPPTTLRAAIVRSRAWSGLGLAVGLVAGVASPRGSALAGAVAGFLIGAAAAAAAPRRAPVGSERVASLIPRRVEDYVAARALHALRAVAVACAAIATAGAVLPSRPAFEPDRGTWLLYGCAALVVALLVEVAARRIVARPQYAATPDDMGVDDMVRSFSVHALVGSGLALVLLLLAAAAWNAGVASDVQVLRWSLPVVGGLALLSAPVVWVRVARRFEGVGRAPAQASASA